MLKMPSTIVKISLMRLIMGSVNVILVTSGLKASSKSVFAHNAMPKNFKENYFFFNVK